MIVNGPNTDLEFLLSTVDTPSRHVPAPAGHRGVPGSLSSDGCPRMEHFCDARGPSY